MEFVSNLAWFVNFAFSSVNEVLQLIISALDMNYIIVSKIIEICFTLWNLFSQWTDTCLSGIICVIEDFSHFLKDIFGGFLVFTQFMWTLVDVSVNASVNFVTSARNLFNSIFSCTFNIASVMEDQSSAFFEIMSHILKLCVAYLVLLFQTLSHVLIIGMKAVTLAVFKLSLKCISSIFVVYHLVKNAIVKLDKFEEAFYGISFNAYTSIVITVISFCILKIILDYVVQHGLLIPDFQLPQHLENVMNYIISFFSQLHHWLISWLFHQNEQSDSEDEENELETEQEDFEEHEQHQETVEQLPVDLNPSKRKSLSRLRFEESDAEDNNGTHLYVKREREKERELCVVCQDHPKNVILLPCRHFCLCQTCRSAIIVLKRGCPICRQPVLDTLHVFT